MVLNLDLVKTVRKHIKVYILSQFNFSTKTYVTCRKMRATFHLRSVGIQMGFKGLA